MCQTRAQGGRRCLKHAGASVAEVHFSWAKTGVDKNTIYATLKELNKEGRKLEAPELAEVKAFLKKEEFVVKHDPDLSERDRKLILKNLAKANDEAEKQSVSGGAFHAWKNVFSKTVEKMKKPLVAAGLVGVLAFSMAGCSSGSLNNGPDGTNVPSPSSSSSSAPVVCSTEDPGPYGDVVAKEKVTDEFGDYCHTTIDPNSDALKYDPAKVDLASLEANGFTEEDAKEAQVTAVTVYSEKILDNSRLDNYSQGAKEWLAENESFIVPKWRQAFSDNVDAGENGTGLSRSGIIVTDILPSPLTRDGGPRALTTNIAVNKIYAVEGKVLVVDMASTSVYKADDAPIVEAVVKNNDSITEDSLKVSNPELFDGTNDSILTLDAKTLLAFDAGNNKQISGSSSVLKLITNSGYAVANNSDN
jgi:hypothetical protein